MTKPKKNNRFERLGEPRKASGTAKSNRGRRLLGSHRKGRTQKKRHKELSFFTHGLDEP